MNQRNGSSRITSNDKSQFQPLVQQEGEGAKHVHYVNCDHLKFLILHADLVLQNRQRKQVPRTTDSHNSLRLNKKKNYVIS